MVVLLAALALAACVGDRGPHPELPYLGVATKFTSRNLCSLGISPEIRLAVQPAGASLYRLRLTAISVLSGVKWQGDVPATGPVVPEGAVINMPLPCPGELQQITYRLEIMALASDYRPVAY